MIVLPFPPPELSPNARLHWSKTSKVKKRYRFSCYIEAKRQGILPMSSGASVTVHLVFFPPDKRARDWDNMLASTKAGLDGLADALHVDDSKWRLSFEVSEIKHKDGKIEVTISEQKL